MMQGDPNAERRRMMLAQLLQGQQPQQAAPNAMAGMAGGLQQAMMRPDVQKYLMTLFQRAPAPVAATSALPMAANGMLPGGV